jgi:euchromatic histone-lysine N-methyltransferase
MLSDNALVEFQEEQKRAQAVLQEGQKRPSKRPDLKAITKMQESNAVLYPEKIIGELPG